MTDDDLRLRLMADAVVAIEEYLVARDATPSSGREHGMQERFTATQYTAMREAVNRVRERVLR